MHQPRGHTRSFRRTESFARIKIAHASRLQEAMLNPHLTACQIRKIQVCNWEKSGRLVFLMVAIAGARNTMFEVSKNFSMTFRMLSKTAIKNNRTVCGRRSRLCQAARTATAMMIIINIGLTDNEDQYIWDGLMGC